MVQIFRKVSAQYGWLFITAAWLYTVSFIFTNYLSPGSSVQKAANTAEKNITNQEKAFERIASDSSTLAALVSENSSPVKQQLFNDALGIFIYQVNDLGNPIPVYWNSNKMFIEEREITLPAGSYAVKHQNGSFEFIKQTFLNRGTQYILCGLIPVEWEYFLENEYLKTQFAVDPDLSAAFELTDNITNSIPIHNSKKQVLFHITGKAGISTDRPGIFSVLLRAVAVIFLMIFINALAEETVRQKGFFPGITFLTGTLFTVRLITYYAPFPFDYRKFELFSPTIYASSSLHPSLGHLFINALLLFWVTAFLRKHFLIEKLKFSGSTAKKIISFFSLPLLVLCTMYISSIIISLVSDSTISLDASNFFSLNIYTFIAFLIVCLLVYSWFYVSFFLLAFSALTITGMAWRLLILAGCALGCISIGLAQNNINIALIVSVWLLVYVFFASGVRNTLSDTFTASPEFIFWAVFLMASAVALIAWQNDYKEKQTRIRIAEKLEMQADPAGESLLKIAITNFSDAFLQNNFYRFSNENENKLIKDSLINENFSGYLNKYDTRIYTFSQTNQPLYNDDSASYNIIKSIVVNMGKSTPTPGLYYYENAADRFSYIYEKQVTDSSRNLLGSLFAVAQPKIYRKEALAPELFKQVNDVMSEMNEDYAYAIYRNYHLVKNFNNYNFSDSISKKELPPAAYAFKNIKGYSELWLNAGLNNTVIIARKNNWLVNGLTLFACNFILFIALALLVHLGNLLIQTGLEREKLRSLFHFNIRSQIQATFIGICIISFVVIGAVTISFFIMRFKKNTRNHLVNTSEIMLNEINNIISSQIDYDTTFTLNDLGLRNELEREIAGLAEIHHTDINLFSPGGTLLVSSQPYIYNKQIISNRMQPQAWYQLHYNHRIQVFETEKIGSFSYTGIYVPVKDESANTIAYINIPYLNSQNELKAEISNFLITLISLNALIFILAGAFALSLTAKITSSFQLIGNKMKEVALGKTNEAIEWKTKDEIGILVKEYNIMVDKLGKSAEALARSEREGAWREMARQVAHEIKNPLTPMKLSIQYLQKAIADNAPNTKELAQHVADTLVEQIDQLSKIAGDFSQFANIGNIRPERFNLAEMITALVNLYSTDSRLNIEFIKNENLTEIMQDKTQINRLFTNLIKNAIEASDEQGKINIYISQHAEDGLIITQIKDEGAGISDDMKQKIFEPNFTTKTSGTGLGLAICKAITEKANGKIWFTTTPGEGSVFYVALPVYE